MKHTSTVLEPSIPFHTRVKLVHAEDIANDKIRTHDLTLEVISIANQLQSQNLDMQQSEKLCFTQTRDPNTKQKPAYKTYCAYCHRTNNSNSVCFKKQRDDEDKTDTYARSQSPQKSFVHYFRSSSCENNSYRTNKPTDPFDRYPRRSTSRHSNSIRNVSQNRYRSSSRDRYRYDRTATPQSNYTDRNQTSRQFIIAFAVADIKYNFLGTTFYEEYISNINIQDITLQFNYKSKDRPNTTKFRS